METHEDLADHLFVENWIRLLDQLDIRPVMDDLRQSRVINSEDEEEVRAGVTTKECIRRLLGKLKRKSSHPTALQDFLRSVKCHQPLLHDDLMCSHSSHPSLQERLKESYARKKALSRKHPWTTERSADLPHGLYTKLKLISQEGYSQNRQDFNQYSAFQEFCRDALPEIEMRQLFTIEESGTRILLEGDPGTGKTTLCNRLVHDFAASDISEDSKYFVHDFDFVVVIEVRNFRSSIRDTLKRSFGWTDQEICNFWRMVQACPHKCLFILDGLDEKMHGFPQELIDLLDGTLFAGTKILATCRPNEANRFCDHFDKFVINVGFSPEQAFQYVQKYFCHLQSTGRSIKLDQITEFLEDQADVLGELLRTPLNCLLLCLWLEELFTSSGRRQPVMQGTRITTTNFYKMVTRSIMKRYCQKEDIPLQRGKIPPSLKEQMVKLYKLALFGVLKEQYKFTIDDLYRHDISEQDDVLKLGLLSREYNVSSIEEEDDIGYSFPHRSIQDFLATEAIEHLPRDLKWHIVAYFGHNSKRNEHICSFLFGIIKDELLLKWLLRCIIESSPFQMSSQGQQDHIKESVTIAEQLIHKLTMIPDSSQDIENLLSQHQVDDNIIVSLKEPHLWLWARSSTGKLDDTMSHCLRMLYEVGSESQSNSQLSLSLIKYLASLSCSRGPDWEAMNECSPEVRTMMINLWCHAECISLSHSQGRFELQASQIRDNAWERLFKLDGLVIHNLEIAYHSPTHLLEVLRSLGPQMSTINSITLSCTSGNIDNWRPGSEDDTKKDITQRVSVKEQLAKIPHLKFLLISGRNIGSCIGFLPTKRVYEEIIIMTQHWSQLETEEIVSEVLSTQAKKVTLINRNVTSSLEFTHVFEALQQSASSMKKTLNEVHLQGFRLTHQGLNQFSRLGEHFTTKQITLRFTECQLMTESIETVEELELKLKVADVPREALSIYSVQNIEESVFEDKDGCMAIFGKKVDLQWNRLGENHMDLVSKVMQAGLASKTVSPRIYCGFVSSFEVYVAPALQKLKPDKVEILFPDSPSEHLIAKIVSVVKIRGGSMGWDHVSRTAFASFTTDMLTLQDNLSRRPFESD